MNKGDYIKNMSYVELAEFLKNFNKDNVIDEWCFKYCPKRPADVNIDCDCQLSEKECILGWLKLKNQ